MIKFEKAEVWGFEHAIRGMRNPMNSWNRSDSKYVGGKYVIGDNDLDLMVRLIRAGAPHRKFLRQIFVSVDITAPLYWFKEQETYKVGTTANSTSTMHRIAAKPFELDDFSYDNLYSDSIDCLDNTIHQLNKYRKRFNETKNKGDWWQMIQLLPSSYNQTRTITMTYENLLNMYEYRRGHKLDEWNEFCDWILTLPYGYLLKEGVTHEPG